MSAAAVLATPEVMPGVPAEPGAPVVVEGMPMVYAQAPVAYAPQVVTYGAMPEQYVYAAPPMQQVVYVNEAGQQVDEAGNLVQVEGQVMEGQVMYAAPEAQQILYVDEHGQPVEVPEGAVFEQPVLYAAPPPVAAPARINVSPEIFAKLAAGGTLTPEEMAQLSGEAAPPQVESAAVPGSPAAAAPAAAPAPAAANASAKASKKKEKGSKKALKASKKKKEKGCC